MIARIQYQGKTYYSFVFAHFEVFYRNQYVVYDPIDNKFDIVAILGDNGYGQRQVGLINERESGFIGQCDFPIKNLCLFASEKSFGKEVIYKDKKYIIDKLSNESIKEIDIVFNGNNEMIHYNFRTRSGNEIDELLAKAYQHIGENQFGAAYDNIHSAEKLIMKEFISQATTEEELYINKILTMQKEDAEWYKVLILMKEGHIFKSRKALKSIANSESRYAEKAKEILEEYLFF